MQDIDAFVTPIISATGPKSIIIFLILFGYIMKMVPNKWFPNFLIPFINCLLLGPLFSVFILKWPSAGSIDPDVRYPEIAAWAFALQTGVILGVLAWILHKVVLTRLIDEKVAAWKKPAKQVSSPE